MKAYEGPNCKTYNSIRTANSHSLCSTFRNEFERQDLVLQDIHPIPTIPPIPPMPTMTGSLLLVAMSLALLISVSECNRKPFHVYSLHGQLAQGPKQQVRVLVMHRSEGARASGAVAVAEGSFGRGRDRER